MTKVLYICNSKEATLKYRVLLPAKHLGADTTHDYTDIPYELKEGRVNVMTMEVRVNKNILGTTQIITRPFSYYDVVVMQHAWDDDLIILILRLKELGIKVVLDYDDDLYHDNPFYPYDYSDGRMKNLTEAIQLADLITVTTPALAETYGKYNKVSTLPNMIDLSEYPIWVQGELKDILIHRKPGKTVGWYSSGIRFEEFKSVMEGWIPEDVHLYLAGSIIFKGFKHENKTVAARFKHEDNPKILSNIDIGLIPLALNRFNNGKSDLKGLEYGAMGIPSIASPTEPYKKLIKHGVNGFLIKHGRDWGKYINLLLDDKTRADMGKEARKVSESRDIRKNIGKWTDVYKII